jgi:ribosomal protein S18 acetylase RimI-like enzyme
MADASDGRLRRYREGDREAVERLDRTALRAAGSNPDDVPDNDDLRDVPGNYLDPGGEFLVVTVDERVVAMGGLAVDGEGDENAGELLRIAVHPDHQRAGHGNRVIAGLERAARERGLNRVVLWTAQRQRAALAFYRDRGYEGVDHRTEGEYELVRFEKRLD